MTGLILTGPTGVGKSTAQEILRKEYGFWVPRTCTTRLPEADEADMMHFSVEDFLHAVRSRGVVLPARFADQWYGWLSADLAALQEQDGRAVLNVRPYTALILHAILPRLVPVWLTLDDVELQRRRASRHAARDHESAARDLRLARDVEDGAYKPCFAYAYPADAELVPRLLALVS